MGLDSVELIIEIEKAFAIKIPDEEAEKLITVGDVHNWVWNHIEQKNSTKCISQVLFYKLRKYISHKNGMPLRTVNFDTSLNGVIPWKDRKKEYAHFAESTGLRLPKLVLSNSWNALLNVVGVISFFGGLIFALAKIMFFNSAAWVMIIPLLGLVLMTLLSMLLHPKRTHIHPDSLKAFTKKTITLNYSFLTQTHGTNRKDVEDMINQIIADTIGVDLAEITPEKSFTDDLGVD
jgi:acyl carrier protein